MQTKTATGREIEPWKYVFDLSVIDYDNGYLSLYGIIGFLLEKRSLKYLNTAARCSTSPPYSLFKYFFDHKAKEWLCEIL